MFIIILQIIFNVKIVKNRKKAQIKPLPVDNLDILFQEFFNAV